MNIKSTKAKEKRMIRKYVPEDILLSDQQHQEMCQIHSTIEAVVPSELESIFMEGDNQGEEVGVSLCQTWEIEQKRKIPCDNLKKIRK